MNEAMDAIDNKDGESEITVPSRRALIRARWAEIVLATTLALYSILAVLAYRYAYFGWDVELARSIQAISIPGFKTVMTAVSVPGNGLVPWVMVTLTGSALVVKQLRLEGLIWVSGVGLGTVLERVMKAVVDRPRPTISAVQVFGQFRHESFPSGHVFFYVSYFGFLLFLLYVLLKPGRWRRALLLIFSLPLVSIGVSRVYLGAHWPSDVIGAYLVGGAWLLLMIETYRRTKARQRLKAEE